MIQYSNLEEIKAQDIPKLLNEIEEELQSRKKLFKRIHRKSKISNVVFDNTGKKNNVTFEKYISLIASGFLGGKAPTYTVNDTIDKTKISLIKKLLSKIVGEKNYKDEMEILIDYFTKYNDDATEHYDLVYDVLSLRGAYEIVYENENNEIVYSKLDPLQTVAVYDYSVPKNLIGIVNRHPERDVDNTLRLIVEITDRNGTRKFSTDIKKENEVIDSKHEFKELTSQYENHNWGDVPAIAVETDEAIFESEVDTILKYERLIKNISNMFQYNDEAKLAIYGYQPENEMVISKEVEQDGKTETIYVSNPAREIEDRGVLESKTLYFPDKSNGGAEWVLKDINDNAIQNTLKTYIDLILMMAGVPNTFDLGFTNADNASAIDRKFFSLIMMTVKIMAEFKKQYLRRWELIFNRINLKKGTNYDFRDIEIDLPLNLPANESEMIDMWTKLRGLVSDETITERLPLGLDYTSEKNKIDKQNQENMENNIENIKQLGKQSKVGDANVEVSRPEDDRTKEDISEDKQADTK